MEDFVEIDLDRDGKVLAPVTDKIALIDADTLAYTSCLNAQQQEALLGDEFYTQDELEEIYSNPNYDADNACIWTINLDAAYQTAMDKLQKIFDKTGCRKAELHFTSGKDNFRYTVDTSYKANRTGRAPTGLGELKQMLCDNFPHTISTKWEADDIWVYKLSQDFKLRESERKELQQLSHKRLLGSDSGAKNTHKMSSTRLYDIWANMLNRCYNNFPGYEEILVFKPWVEDFSIFRDFALTIGYSENLTIDRINTNGHYIPSNIQFITKQDNTAKSGYEREKGCSWDELRELLVLKNSFPKATGTYKGSFKEYLDSRYSPSLTRGIQARLYKYQDSLYLAEEDFIASKLSEGVKFKLGSYYYVVRKGKAEFYRDYIGVAVDKDCLSSVATSDICKSFNYYESAKYNIDMTWVTVDAETAMKWPYIQALLGDTVDNIKGVKGIGKAKAPKILANCKTELQCWEAVVAEYEKAGMGMMEAVQTMQLVSMNQFDGEKIVLWDPRNLKCL